MVSIKIIDRFDLKKVKTIGDAYMAVGGVPDLNSNHAERVVLAAKRDYKFLLKVLTINKVQSERRRGI